MTLSLDEVRNIRFPMARKPSEDGYRASAVDNFMDKLEISYAQLTEELEQLRAGGSGGEAASSEADDALRNELKNAQAASSRLAGELDALRNEHASLQTASSQLHQENERLSSEVAQLRGQLDELRASSDLSKTGGEQLRAENENLHRQLEELRGQLNNSQQELAAAQQRAEAAQQAPAPAPRQVLDGSDGDVRQIRVTTSSEASSAVVRLVELATEQAETLLADADAEAHRRITEAVGQAERTTAEARARAEQLDHESRSRADQLDRESKARAEQLDTETRQQADRILGEARGRADRLDAEVRERRAELFTGLENDRDVLVDRVNQLRDYEENYRRTFNGFLQSQIDQLGQTSISPSQRPDTDAMYGLGQSHVSTPRLDALVDESRQELN